MSSDKYPRKMIVFVVPFSILMAKYCSESVYMVFSFTDFYPKQRTTITIFFVQTLLSLEEYLYWRTITNSFQRQKITSMSLTN